jgi:hypothetical protein
MQRREPPKARLRVAIPQERVDRTQGDGVSLPKAGDIVELDQGFTGLRGESMGIVVCINADGSTRWVADAFESELELLDEASKAP